MILSYDPLFLPDQVLYLYNTSGALPLQKHWRRTIKVEDTTNSLLPREVTYLFIFVLLQLDLFKKSV